MKSILYEQSNVEHHSIVTGFRQKVYKYIQHSNTYEIKKKPIQTIQNSKIDYTARYNRPTYSLARLFL